MLDGQFFMVKARNLLALQTNGVGFTIDILVPTIEVF